MTIKCDSDDTTGIGRDEMKPRFFEDHYAFSCDIAIVREDSGFSSHVENLPGAVSQGDTVDEAVENIKDALREVISEYQNIGSPIPWESSPVDGDVVCRKRIVVNV